MVSGLILRLFGRSSERVKLSVRYRPFLRRGWRAGENPHRPDAPRIRLQSEPTSRRPHWHTAILARLSILKGRIDFGASNVLSWLLYDEPKLPSLMTIFHKTFSCCSSRREKAFIIPNFAARIPHLDQPLHAARYGKVILYLVVCLAAAASTFAQHQV